jgi:hypothetical protein
VPFEIRVIEEQVPILEVVYPSEPSHADVAGYLLEMKRTIDERGGQPWMCLVDQRRLVTMDPVLLERVAVLNAYAQSNGMTRSARVVASVIATLQVQRIAEQAGLRAPVRAFTSRNEALAWLRSDG